MNFYKRDLTFNYSNDNEIKLLIPYVMIETTKQVYGVSCETFQVSIECMWNLVTASQRDLGKRERTKIVELFKRYLDDNTLDDFKSLVVLDGKCYTKGHFIKVEMKDITTIFIKSTLAKLPKHLAILLNVQSYFDGTWSYLSFDDLVFKVTSGKYSEAEINWDEPNWFKKHTVEELNDIKNKFIAFNDIENILTSRHNEDKDKLDKMFLARDNFDKYMKELESWNIICKVKTNCGTYDNKRVFCRVEHKKVVEQYYIRVDEVGAFAERKQQEEPKQPIEQPKQSRRIRRWD